MGGPSLVIIPGIRNTRVMRGVRNMRYSGNLVQWNDERGFGWIESSDGAERVFVHISAFTPRPSADQRPKNGQQLEFAIEVQDGKKRAQQVSWNSSAQPTGRGTSPARGSAASSQTRAQVQANSQVNAKSQNSNRQVARTERRAGQQEGMRTSSRFSYGALLVWVVVMAGLAWKWGVPGKVLMVYGVLSLITFISYWRDKTAAQKGAWRTAESTLQTMALAGGWPGAVLAQQWLRHKTSKASFQVTFWTMVSINMLGVIWLCSPYGRPWLMHWAG